MIDYNLIGMAVQAYQQLGYERVEPPWFVDPETTRITHPRGTERFEVRRVDSFSLGGAWELVASGEQSLLQNRRGLMGKYVCATPCFRAEPKLEPGITETQFFKVELMWANPLNPEGMLRAVIRDALSFMSRFSQLLRLVETSDGWDIMAGQYELGSYGIRHYGDFGWVYGTGIAEPRFSTVLQRLST